MEIQIKVMPAKFERHETYSVVIIKPFDPVAYEITRLCKNTDELNHDLDLVAEHMRRTAPGQSFRVSAYAAHKAQRAFPGFRQGRWFRDVDAADASEAKA